MDDKDKKEGTCGLKCCCCTCKAIRGALVLVLGGVIGYMAGRCGGARRMCPMPEGGSSMHHADAPAAAPAEAVKKTK
ncbi:MAG: hypothetical protein HY403_09905 [Elusimicrobia bacterium]|nr:hypothetical protein [Elusimicrobiota bacterium]